MPKEIAVAPVDHKWGSGPYHFSEEAMRWVGQKRWESSTVNPRPEFYVIELVLLLL